MNDQVSSPADRYKDATVVDKPKSSGGSIGDRYKGYTVVEPGDAQRAHAAEETEKQLGSGGFGPATQKHTIGDWFGDAARATILGPLGDVVGAQYLSMTNEGVTYKKALQAVRKSRKEKGVSGSATLVGAIIGGGFIYKGGKYALQTAATKSGMIDGAMKWASSNSRVKRVAAAAAAGAGIGGVEEAVRSTLEESVDASGGMAFDGDRVINNTLVGAFTGAAAAPVIEGVAGGSKWVVDFYRRQDASNPEAAVDAARRTIQAFKRDDETFEVAAERYSRKAAAYEMKHKRKASAAALLAPEEVSQVSEVIRSYNGLDKYARELGEEGVEKGLRELDQVVTEGNIIPAPNTIREAANEMMNDVITRNGNTMVTVDDMTLKGLQNRSGLIDTLADHGNEGAARIKKLLDARRNVDDLTNKMARAADNVNDAGGRLDVAQYREDLGRLVDDLHQQAAKRPDDMDLQDKIHDLRNTIQLRNAIEKRAAAGRASGRADNNYNELARLHSLANAELRNHAENGMKIALRDANNMRHSASDRAFKLRMTDPDKSAEARVMRDLIAPIGTTEVPEYGKVIKRYNLESLRAEGQDMGSAGARGQLDLNELETNLRVGKAGKNRPKQGSDIQKRFLLEGTAEGSRRTIQNEVRDTTSSGIKAADRLSTSKQTQGALEQTLGKGDADAIKEVADQVMKEYDNFVVMAKPTSVSDLAEERRFMQEVATGSVFSTLGGAGKAAILTRLLTRAAVPRGTAKKMIDMLGKEGEVEDALRIMQKKGIRLGPLGAAILAGLGSPQENTD